MVLPTNSATLHEDTERLNNIHTLQRLGWTLTLRFSHIGLVFGVMLAIRVTHLGWISAICSADIHDYL